MIHRNPVENRLCDINPYCSNLPAPRADSSRAGFPPLRKASTAGIIAFLAYCLPITLGRKLHALAPGLTARSALEKFAAVQMIDVHIPTTDGREIQLTRYTQPEPELKLLLDRLKLTLPEQLPPKITAAQATTATPL